MNEILYFTSILVNNIKIEFQNYFKKKLGNYDYILGFIRPAETLGWCHTIYRTFLRTGHKMTIMFLLMSKRSWLMCLVGQMWSAAPWSYLLLLLLRVVHAALQVLQLVVHLLDLRLSVSDTLHHVLQLHHTLICFFLKLVRSKTLLFSGMPWTGSRHQSNTVTKQQLSEGGPLPAFLTHNGALDVLDVLPHLLHLTLQLLWRLHDLRLQFADVFLQVADVHLHLGLTQTSREHMSRR